MVDLESHRLHFKGFDQVHSCNVSILSVVAAAAVALVILCRFVCQDYRAFRSLGPGGTPSNFKGYLRISALRLFRIKDPLTPPQDVQDVVPCSNYLLRLPRRCNPRPRVDGIAPHRQTEQKPGRHPHQALRRALHFLASDNAAYLTQGTSCLEKNGLALFFSDVPEPVEPGITQEHERTQIGSHGIKKTCKDVAEFCHLHPSVRK